MREAFYAKWISERRQSVIQIAVLLLLLLSGDTALLLVESVQAESEDTCRAIKDDNASIGIATLRRDTCSLSRSGVSVQHSECCHFYTICRLQETLGQHCAISREQQEKVEQRKCSLKL